MMSNDLLVEPSLADEAVVRTAMANIYETGNARCRKKKVKMKAPLF